MPFRPEHNSQMSARKEYPCILIQNPSGGERITSGRTRFIKNSFYAPHVSKELPDTLISGLSRLKILLFAVVFPSIKRIHIFTPPCSCISFPSSVLFYIFFFVFYFYSALPFPSLLYVTLWSALLLKGAPHKKEKLPCNAFLGIRGSFTSTSLPVCCKAFW